MAGQRSDLSTLADSMHSFTCARAGFLTAVLVSVSKHAGCKQASME